MKVKVQVIIEDENEGPLMIEEVACLCRGDLLPETLGLTLVEGKHLLTQIQEKMVAHQPAGASGRAAATLPRTLRRPYTLAAVSRADSPAVVV